MKALKINKSFYIQILKNDFLYCIYFNFIYYVLTLYEHSDKTRGPVVSILLYHLLNSFCIDMHVDGLNTDRKM
jgi:hypothetical protein